MTLQIKHLSTLYKGSTEPAISDINLTIQQGEFVGILGRSGAGKSTFVRSINQLIKPTSGQVIWNNTILNKLKGKQLRQARRDIGMIFQQFNLIPRLTVLQNAVMGLFGYRPAWSNVVGFISKEEKEKAMIALERVGIQHLAHKRVDQLSGGQQQRVAIARVLMQQPKMLLGDEPVASLDPVTSKQVMSMIRDIHQAEHMTSVINLHDVQLALAYCDRIIGLSHGKVVFDGLPAHVNDEVLNRIYA